MVFPQYKIIPFKKGLIIITNDKTLCMELLNNANWVPYITIGNHNSFISTNIVSHLADKQLMRITSGELFSKSKSLSIPHKNATLAAMS